MALLVLLIIVVMDSRSIFAGKALSGKAFGVMRKRRL
jgi:hypothetical protein